MLFSKLANLPRKIKVWIMVFADLLLIPMALWSAIALRLGTFDVPLENIWWVFILVPIFTLPLFLRLGLYRAVIRYFDEKIILTIVLGVTISVLFMTAVVFLSQTYGIPRSSIVIYWVICVTYITLSRYMARGLMRQIERSERRQQKVAIYGAGRSGLQTALSMLQSPDYHPVLFFDDNPELQGRTVAGIRVYKPENAIQLMAQHDCYQLLFAIPSASLQQRQKIIQQFEQKNIQMKIIPGLSSIVDGKVKIESIREVGVEDLLGRDPVPPNEELIKKIISNKVILVTGGGGSIGSELCRQILKRQPKKLIIFERSEFLLYSIDKELNSLKNSSKNDVEIVPVLGDILDTEKLNTMLKLYEVESVYHAAAYKHVPLVELNMSAGVENNILGTQSVLKAIENTKVKNFILISSDKAVRPTNVMGASKRVAEMCVQIQADSQNQTDKTIFSMVRFGNVLGSSGSVVPLFKEQIKAGGPVTVTHPEITRYFMTIPEACELVLQAAAMAEGGDLFVLDMGNPVKIVDMARNMIRLSGFSVRDDQNPDGDIAIEFVGLRSGEKLYEELLIGNNVSATTHPRIMRAQENFLAADKFGQHLGNLEKYCNKSDERNLVEELKKLVPEFSHKESSSKS